MPADSRPALIIPGLPSLSARPAELVSALEDAKRVVAEKEQLRAENEKLRAENEQLRAENEQLKTQKEQELSASKKREKDIDDANIKMALMNAERQENGERKLITEARNEAMEAMTSSKSDDMYIADLVKKFKTLSKQAQDLDKKNLELLKTIEENAKKEKEVLATLTQPGTQPKAAAAASSLSSPGQRH